MPFTSINCFIVNQTAIKTTKIHKIATDTLDK